MSIPVDTRRKLNVHKTFRRRPGCLRDVLFTFNLRSVSTGMRYYVFKQDSLWFEDYEKTQVKKDTDTKIFENKSTALHKKMKFSIKDFFSKCADLVTFTEEILNWKLHFLCSAVCNAHDVSPQLSLFLSHGFHWKQSVLYDTNNW